MSAAVTTIDSSTGDVQISWVAPNNGQDPIQYYTIWILDSTSNPVSATLNGDCDGSNTIIMANLKCIVPMSALSDAAGDYKLAFNDLVQVQISATNSHGTSTLSPVNTAGARIRSAPQTMVAPTITSYSDSSISVSWSSLSGTTAGNSDILSYELQIAIDATLPQTAAFSTVQDVLTTSYVVSVPAANKGKYYSF